MAQKTRWGLVVLTDWAGLVEDVSSEANGRGNRTSSGALSGLFEHLRRLPDRVWSPLREAVAGTAIGPVAALVSAVVDEVDYRRAGNVAVLRPRLVAGAP